MKEFWTTIQVVFAGIGGWLEKIMQNMARYEYFDT